MIALRQRPSHIIGGWVVIDQQQMRHSSSAVYHCKVSEPSQPKRRSAKLPEHIATKLQNNQTIELDTADFDELAQDGMIAERTRADPTEPASAEPKVVVELEESAQPDGRTLLDVERISIDNDIVDNIVGNNVGNNVDNNVDNNNKMMAAMPPHGRGMRGLMIAIYVVVVVVLGLSLYYRFT